MAIPFEPSCPPPQICAQKSGQFGIFFSRYAFCLCLNRVDKSGVVDILGSFVPSLFPGSDKLKKKATEASATGAMKTVLVPYWILQRACSFLDPADSVNVRKTYHRVRVCAAGRAICSHRVCGCAIGVPLPSLSLRLVSTLAVSVMPLDFFIASLPRNELCRGWLLTEPLTFGKMAKKMYVNY